MLHRSGGALVCSRSRVDLFLVGVSTVDKLHHTQSKHQPQAPPPHPLSCVPEAVKTIAISDHAAGDCCRGRGVFVQLAERSQDPAHFLDLLQVPAPGYHSSMTSSQAATAAASNQAAVSARRAADRGVGGSEQAPPQEGGDGWSGHQQRSAGGVVASHAFTWRRMCLQRRIQLSSPGREQPAASK